MQPLNSSLQVGSRNEGGNEGLKAQVRKTLPLLILASFPRLAASPFRVRRPERLYVKSKSSSGGGGRPSEPRASGFLFPRNGPLEYVTLGMLFGSSANSWITTSDNTSQSYPPPPLLQRILIRSVVKI